MSILKEVVGKIQGQDVVSYSLSNKAGMEVKVLNYGGIITDILLEDRNGKKENVVLRYKDIQDYEKNPSYLGAFIGRTAGRVCNGEVVLNGERLEFNKNYNPHQGHGGNEGFDKKFYDVITEELESEAYVELSRISENLEENYPGNLEVRVRYTLNDDNELIISYYAKSDKDTLVNFTNHSYFNLSGNGKENILDHNLYINGDKIVEVNEVQATTGNLLNIRNTEFDFKEEKRIGKDINGSHEQLKIGFGYDVPWYLNEDEDVKLRLSHRESGRILEVSTDRQAIVVYTHNYPDDQVLQNNKAGEMRYGVAIEPQNPPIGVNNSFLEESILRTGEEYRAKTVYKFTVSR